MTYKLKKDHLTNWDVKEPNEKPIFNDDQDSYISERSSTPSLEENTSSPKLYNKELSPPLPSIQSQPKPQKQPHNLKYYYNELPENGIPAAIQLKHAKKEEEQIRKNYRKAPPGQGNLAQLPETKSSELADNYYPYWYYYKVKNPDWIARHRQTTNGQLIPYDTVDPSQYVHPPALSTPTKKSRRHHRKSHHDSTIMQYNPGKKGYDIVRKNSQRTTFNENYQQPRSSPKQYTPLKIAGNEEYSDQFSTEIKQQQREKLKTENDWNNHYLQSSTTSKSSQDSNNLNSNSNTSKHRSKHHHHHHHHHSKEMNNIVPNENKNHHHHHHHSPSQSQHHHHHSPSQSQHHHHLRYSPSKEYENSEFQVIDASFKKTERTSYFQPRQNSFHSPPPAIYNQNSYLPPITRDNHYYRPTPTNYYSTSTLSHDWKEPIKSPRMYKPDKQTNFYDRYLNNVITKKIT